MRERGEPSPLLRADPFAVPELLAGLASGDGRAGRAVKLAIQDRYIGRLDGSRASRGAGRQTIVIPREARSYTSSPQDAATDLLVPLRPLARDSASPACPR